MQRTLLILSIFIFLQACAPYSVLNNKELKLYERQFFVQHAIFHDGLNSELIIELPTFKGTIEFRVYYAKRKTEEIYLHKGNIEVRKPNHFRHSFQVNVEQCLAELILKNENDRVVFHDIIAIDKRANSPQHTRLTDANGKAFLQKYVSPGEDLNIESAFGDTLYVKYFRERYRPAPPPYSKRGLQFVASYGYEELFILKEGSGFRLDEAGLYFVQNDTSSQEGRFISCYLEDYPKMTSADELIEATRYITTNQEYLKMRNAKDRKAALDNYWLEIGGSPERGKELIRAFYNRALETNKYFTSYKEGWKTDRGMIYLIFGHPDKIFKSLNKEVWKYDSNPRRPSTEFSFIRYTHDVHLQRGSFTEMPWSLKVNDWREGVL